MKTLHKIVIVFFLFISLNFSSYSQNGSISGVVRSKSTKETLIGASVIIDNKYIGASTDIDGFYVIDNLEQGTYDIIVSYISYKTAIIKGIKVKSNSITNIEVYLDDEISNLQAVTVVGERRTNTELSMISAIKNSNIITNGVSAQQISKTSDRDASEVLKRVSGITLSENRFIMVRGLSERYNTVLLNNFATPSSETDVKAFSFDMIPSSLIEKIKISKTPAPELPGDFAGGAILIQTKNEFDKEGLDVRYSASYRPNTSFSSFYSNIAGTYNFLGINNEREQVDNLKITPNEVKDTRQISTVKQNQWTPDEKIAMPDQRFSLLYTKKIILKKVLINCLNSINYTNTNNSDLYKRNYYLTFDKLKQQSDTSWSYQDMQYTNSVKIGAMSNWNIVINERNRIEIRNFLNHFSNNITVVRNGNDFDNLQAKIRAYQFGYMQRTIYSGQVVGKHNLSKNNISNLEWGVGFARANRNEPDIKRLTQVLDNSDPTSANYNKYYTILSSFADPRFAGRLFMQTNEQILNFSAQFEQNIKKSNPKFLMKIGVFAEQKQRDFSARLFGYATSPACPWTIIYQPIDSLFSAKNPDGTNSLILKEKTNPSDSYYSEGTIAATYVAFNIPLTKKINIYTGVRVETNDQVLNSFSSDYNKIPIDVSNSYTNAFPSINLTYNFNDKKMLRFAYGITLNKPEFRELAPFAFYDFNMAATIRGNENLLNATIHNCDIKYEFYPSLIETFSIGAFGKYFLNPIESVLTPSGSDVNYSFKNADFSTSYGIEVEARKAFKIKDEFLISNIINNMGVLINSSVIKSNIFFESVQEKIGERPMQGQSPYIINTGLFFQSDSIGLQFSLQYNLMGKRIIYVGDGATPDVYELPKHLIDFTISKTLYRNIKINGSINDLLNLPTQFCQFVGENNAVKQMTLSMRRGTYFSFGITVSL